MWSYTQIGLKVDQSQLQTLDTRLTELQQTMNDGKQIIVVMFLTVYTRTCTHSSTHRCDV